MKTYVTFGTAHRHEVYDLDAVFDSNCVARLECDGPVDGRERAFRLFGPVFAFEYHEDEWNPEDLRYYPRGYIDVPREYTNSIAEDNDDDSENDQ